MPKLLEGPKWQTTVASTIVEVKGEHYWVSTMRVARRHNEYDTMVFPSDERGQVEDLMYIYAERYQTEEEARKGHQRIVSLLAGLGKLPTYQPPRSAGSGQAKPPAPPRVIRSGKPYRNSLGSTVVELEGRHYWVSTLRAPGSNDYFDTLVFPCDENGQVTDYAYVYQERYSTLEEAQAGHERVVRNLAELVWVKE